MPGKPSDGLDIIISLIQQGAQASINHEIRIARLEELFGSLIIWACQYCGHVNTTPSIVFPYVAGYYPGCESCGYLQNLKDVIILGHDQLGELV